MRFEDVDASTPANGLVRIAVRASAINYFDALMIAGQYQVKPELPFVPGAEASGVVESAPRSSGFKPGDRVTALLDSAGLTRGGYAEISDAAPASVQRMPDAMSFEDGAGFTLIFQTAWFGLHRRAKLLSGEVLLVHAGAGGVGSAAIQVGKAAGAMVIATAGSDVIFDPVGGDVYDRSTKCVAFEGRIVIVGFTSGRIPQAATNHVLVKNYSVVGLHWGLYSRRAPELLPAATSALMDLYASGKIKPLISARVPLAEAPSALAMVAGGKSTGKVILTV